MTSASLIRRASSAMALLALLLALVAAAWWHFSPRWTVASMQRAALSGDVAALEARIDFLALRGSLTDQLEMQLQAEARSARTPLARFGLELAVGFVQQMVEAAVTAETLRFALALGEEAALPAGLPALAALAAPQPAIARDGLDGFAVRAGKDPDAPALQFCREGLSWKLCGVDLGAVRA
ncbi:MAG: DUF2939 domain-containing protein [Thermaurantiacus sp.]